eukprot:961429-Prymnesium_polylepis.1
MRLQAAARAFCQRRRSSEEQLIVRDLDRGVKLSLSEANTACQTFVIQSTSGAPPLADEPELLTDEEFEEDEDEYDDEYDDDDDDDYDDDDDDEFYEDDEDDVDEAATARGSPASGRN